MPSEGETDFDEGDTVDSLPDEVDEDTTVSDFDHPDQVAEYVENNANFAEYEFNAIT